jgi:hypothetical protein
MMWHAGLLHNLTQALPLNYFLLLKSYLHNRHFRVKVQNDYSQLTSIHAGIPQGSILRPLLYLLYTADLPTSPRTFIATFAYDTPILTTDSDPAVVSHLLQMHLLDIQHYLKRWKMKLNETNSTHVTFTTRPPTCPPVKINDVLLPQSVDVKYRDLHLDRQLT